ncbi:MAG: hypothetical protein ACKOT0_02010, partial [bacterium]
GGDRCGARLVRHVVRSGSVALPAELAACAADAPPIRAVGGYPDSWRGSARPPGAPAGASALVAITAVDTAADMLDRWWQSYSADGLGLRGGTWSVAGDRRVEFDLDGVRLVRDLPVSGRLAGDRDTGAVTCDLRVPSTAGVRRVVGTWNADSADAEATVRVTGSGGASELRFLAP